jgi:hypothetical protein
MKTEDMLALVNSGFLQEKEMDMWCTTAGDPYPMEKNPDEVPMFARFVERGLALQASDFFKCLLKYYGIEYLNLNPNGIFHVSAFVHSTKPSWGSNSTGSCFGNFGSNGVEWIHLVENIFAIPLLQIRAFMLETQVLHLFTCRRFSKCFKRQPNNI